MGKLHQIRVLIIGAGAFSVMSTAIISASSAQSVAEFYKGTMLRIIVGSAPGGTYDLSARLLGQYMTNYIPGNPKFIVQNRPGAGSVVAANEVYNVLPQDGSVIGAPQRSLVVEDVLGNVTSISFDSSKFQWIGSITEDASAMPIMTRSGISSFEDLKTKELVVGSTGGGEFYPELMIQALGAKIKIVRGYRSLGPLMLALERGEVDGGLMSVASFVTQHPELLKKGEAKFIYKAGFTRDPDNSEIPLLTDFVTQENLLPGFKLDELMSLLKIRMSDVPMGRAYMMGPGVPADRVAAIRKAFDATVKDPGFLEMAEKSKLKINPKPGQELQEIVRELKEIPKERVDYLSKLIDYAR